MRRIAVVNMKGGVGKTTTAIHLASGFALRGSRTLLVDGDPQGTIGQFLRLRPARTLTDLMTGSEAASVIVSSGRENMDVVVSTPAAFTLDTQLAGTIQRETVLRRALAPLTHYDTVVVDTSPAMGLLTYNALLYATELVIPVSMEPMALTGARQTLDGIEHIRSLWPEHPLTLIAVVPTGVNLGTHASRATLDALQNDARMQAAVVPGIRQCIDLTYAVASSQSIWEYAPASRAAADYTTLVDTLVNVETAKRTPHGQIEKTQTVL
jgi:chromosome partitioning protein